jgi:hypothetical protein
MDPWVRNAVREGAVPALALGGGLLILCRIWLPDLPNADGRMGADYAFWLPNLLAGDFWHARNGWWLVPWFTPASCGGAPLNADPQGAYLSLPQLLSFAVAPVRAVRISFVLFAAAGFVGMHRLARGGFRLGRAASLLASLLFLFNGFFAVRMMVGHLSFAPFMLLPAMAACAVGPPADRRGTVLRVGLFGLLLAVMLQAGMTVLVLPAFLSLAIVGVMQALATGDALWPAVVRGAAGTALGFALSAGRLAYVFALMGNMPRTSYPLPGFSTLPESAWVAFRGLFLWPAPGMTDALVNTALRFQLHEFDYRVGPVPLVLMLAAAWRRSGAPGERRRRVLWEVLALLLVIPLVLNTHAAGWTAFLKALPVIGASSSLLRWFAAYILPAALGGAVALDRIAAQAGNGGGVLAAAGAVATVVALLAPDRAFYGPNGLGFYDPVRIEASWRAVASGQAVPSVTGIADTALDGGRDSMQRQDALTAGLSQKTCYDPLFGYRLEFLPQAALHVGPALAVGLPGRLNLINPACYVFPAANGCAPGDAFRTDQHAAAARFLAYRPFGARVPAMAAAAGWLSLAAFGGTLVAMAACLAGAARRGA